MSKPASKRSRDHVGPRASLTASVFVSDDAAKFRTRGLLLLKAGRESSVSVSQNQLSEEDRVRLRVRPGGGGAAGPRGSSAVTDSVGLSLKDVAAVDGLYRIRVPRVSLQAERQAEGYLSTFVRAVRVLRVPGVGGGVGAAAFEPAFLLCSSAPCWSPT